MRESGYKISAKSAALQFPLGSRDKRIVHRKRRRGIKRKSPRSITGKKNRATKKEKKIRAARRKTKNNPLVNIESRNATYPIYSLN